MTDLSERNVLTTSPFAGLKPRRQNAIPVQREQSRIARSMLATVPVVLVGTLAIATMNATGTVDTGIKRPHRDGAGTADLSRTVRNALARAAHAAPVDATPASSIVAESVPTTYTVRGGDTVSGIASHYGLATASVLALNGLSWKSLIFPGQVLKLTKATSTPPAVAAASPAMSGKYTIVAGDTISGIAQRLGVSMQSLLQTNGLTASSIIFSGRTLIIPGTPAPAATTGIQPVVYTAPIAAAPAAPSGAIPSATKTYTIVPGDTVTAIAKKLGVTVQAILTANGMTASSIIYSGRTLTIPGASASTPATTVAQVGGSTTPLTPDMQSNAKTIIAVGRQLGVPDYGIVIALAAAAQESGLRNLTGGDHDSLGLFQQRPSSGWGTQAQILNTTYASELFFGGAHNPNKGKTRGLLDIPGWQSMTVTQAAQAVQISAYPNAYAKWETSARAWYAALG
jgi:LysM repeat protein